MTKDNAELRRVWPALESSFDGGRAELRCLGREYRIEGALPVSMVSGGREVLAAPARFTARFRGEEKPFTGLSGYVTRQDGDMLEYQCQQTAGNVILNARVRAEYDGLVWADLLLIPFGVDGAPTHSPAEAEPCLESLAIEFPVKRELAELYHYWPIEDGWGSLANSGAVPEEGMRLGFKPNMWFGREEAGLSLYSESDEFRQYADPGQALTLETEGDAAVIRMHLLDSMPEAWKDPIPDAPLPPVRFSFGWQATPVKKFAPDESFLRTFHRGVTNSSTEDPYGLGTFEKEADELQALGVKWRTFHEDWSIVQNYGLPKDEALFKAKVDALHKRGMRAMVYFGYEYATAAPGFFDNYESFLVRNAAGGLRGGWQRLPYQRDYVVCYAGGYSEVMLERCRRAMDEYGVDGIYTDGTYEPWPCANAAHGCGYNDREGRRHVTYPLLALREHVRKLFIQTHERGGIVEAHQSSCVAPLITAYCDSYWDGEHIALTSDPETGRHIVLSGEQLAERYLSGGAGTATFRAEFTGVNFGIPCQFLSYAPTYEESFGMPMLFGTLPKVSGAIEKVRQASYHWKVRADLALEKARFIPFWREDCPVKADDPRVRCSVWETGAGLAAMAANLTGGEVKTALRSAREYSRAVDVKTGTPLAADGVCIPPMTAVYVFFEK